MDTPSLLVSCKAPYDYTSTESSVSNGQILIISVIFFLWVYSVLFEISIYNNWRTMQLGDKYRILWNTNWLTHR